MKPSFALNLSHDGIGLLHRAGPGWFTVGEVSLDDPDLPGALSRLRRTALGLEPKGLVSKLIVPATQILYTEIEAPGPDAARRRTQIAAALEGRTPYAVEDLVFDWSGNGDKVQVAVVARDTLSEAEEFAETYGFCPVAFVASPAPGTFGGEPFFGLTSHAAQHLPEGAKLDRDQDPVRPGGPVRPPVAPAPAPVSEPEAEAEPESPPAEIPAPEPEPQPEVSVAPEPVEPPPATETPQIETAEAATDAAAPDAVAPDAVATDAAPDQPEAAPPEPEAVPEAPMAVLDDEAPEDDQVELATPEAATPDTKAEPPPEAVKPTPELAATDADAPPASVDPAPEAAPIGDAEAPAASDSAETPEPAADPTAGDDLSPADGSAPPVETDGQTASDDIGSHETEKAPSLPPLRTSGVATRRLGAAVGREELPPLPHGKRLSLSGTTANVVAPGLALPNEEVAPPPSTKRAQRGPAKPATSGARARFVSAARGTAALGGAAGKALARGLVGKNKAKPADAAASPGAPGKAKTPEPERTVFGARKLQNVGGKLRYLGLALTLGLLIFMGIVVLWTSFLGGSDPQDQQIASTSAPAASDVANAPEPAAQEAPEPADSAVEEAAPAQVEPDTRIAATAPEASDTASAETPTEPEPDAAVQQAPSAEPVPAAPDLAVAPPADAADVPDVWGERAATAANEAGQAAPALPGGSSADPELPPAPNAALPSPDSLITDAVPRPLPLPAPFEQLARVNPDGQIEPTVQGVAMPGGFTLYAGKPPLVPAPRPDAVTQAAVAASNPPTTAPDAAAPQDGASEPEAPVVDEPYADPALAGFRPAARPASIVPPVDTTTPAAPEATEATEDPQDDGAALTPEQSPEDKRLAAAKPRARPQAVAIANERFAEQRAAEEAAAAAAQEAIASASKQAVAVSRRPAAKPRDFSNAVAAAVAAAVAETTIRSAPTPEPAAAPKAAPKQAAAAAPPPEEIDEPEPVAAAPRVPTSASVAKQATQKNVLNLGKMNLIGLYGSANNRRALVRMSNGKFVKVSVGDRLDGGRVTAIGEGQLTYQKSGRNLVLKLLKGS